MSAAAAERAQRCAVVSGAAAGIGEATVARLLDDGWLVVALDRDGEALRALALRHPQLGCVAGDVRERDAHERAAALARERGRLRGWVNNAGIHRPARADAATDADVRDTIDVDLLGAMTGAAVAIAAFLDDGEPGAIVNVSSVHATSGFPGAFAYQAAKGGLDAVTRQLAVEYGAVGIRVNAVRPGTVMTPLTQQYLDAAEDADAALRAYAAMHPLDRVAEPAEVAAAIAFLLGEDASFVSGVSLAVDGGASARCYGYPPDPEMLARFAAARTRRGPDA